jgi:uncharacterized protein YheU (UPF0270 family)
MADAGETRASQSARARATDVTTMTSTATLRGMDEQDADVSVYVEIPVQELSQGALHGIVEEFITREGTDYGLREHTFDEKRASVLKLIAAGEVAIFFDTESETTTLRRR